MSVTLASLISKHSSFSSESCFSNSSAKINRSNKKNHLSFSRSGAGNSFTVKSYAGGSSSAGGTAVMERRKTSTTSLYDLLGIKRNASQIEIKTAYRSLAKVYHPDAASESDDGRDFIAIHDAYATLSDPSSRALYDLSLGVGCGLSSVSYSSPFCRSSSSRSSSGYATTRRWETDQCW